MRSVDSFPGERALAATAVRLGAREVAGWSAEEQCLAGCTPGGDDIGVIRDAIAAGQDPLGEALCRLRPSSWRRACGQTFTPAPVVDAMVGWAAGAMSPARVVDPGVGSGRFLVAAGRRWPSAELVGVDTDPLAAITARATLAAAGLARRARVLVADYRSVWLAPAAGPTLFLGNPPYVRHHRIPAHWKEWLRRTAHGQGLAASGLAGLHVHFYLATALHAAPGDAGVLVTAAEWLDVNYGQLVRSLLLGRLGGESVHVLDPAVPVFPDAAATAAITCFRPGTEPGSLRVRRVRRLADLGVMAGGRAVPTSLLRGQARWSPLVDNWPGPAARQPVPRSRGGSPSGYIQLGELCRVHRGQVTGANRVWITAAGDSGLPARFLAPAVTRARELFAAGPALTSLAGLRCVIDLPADPHDLAGPEADLVAAFLGRARAAGAADSYVARHRRPWWRVGLRAPAPILATYMARRSPAFVRNHAGARHVNIAHGLYPRQVLTQAALDGLAAFLRCTVTQAQGRTYAGGLTKFEPGEMERLPVPEPGLLASHAPGLMDEVTARR